AGGIGRLVSAVRRLQPASAQNKMSTFAWPPRAAKALASFIVGLLGLSLQLSPLPARAQQPPHISPALKQILGGLPIGKAQDEIKQMAMALKQTTCGGGLTGCYMAQSGPLQLYLFSSKPTEQTVLLLLDKKMVMPPLLKA